MYFCIVNRSNHTYCQNTTNATHSGTFAGFVSTDEEKASGFLDSKVQRDSLFSGFVFTGKERDEETGYGYFGARYMDHELTTMWLSVDPMADKYPSISPYAYCAWNPIKLVDSDGREIDISALYDKKGNCKYDFIEKALRTFAKTKIGYKELSKYAKANQEFLGVKFDKDGKYHSKGIDLSFGGKTSSIQYSGDTGRKIVNGRLKVSINLSNVSDIKSIFETICHETFIHARQASADFLDDKKLNHSYLKPHLKNYVKKYGESGGAYINAEHAQFVWYDKASQNDFINTNRKTALLVRDRFCHIHIRLNRVR